MPAGVFKRCLVWGEITSFGVRGGLELTAPGMHAGASEGTDSQAEQDVWA